jgi:branched-chain amino acid transport system permease protein
VLVGGLESVPGAIIAGLIIGVAEGLASGYIDPMVGGGIAEVFAYALAIVSLLIWPYGLFGLRRIERI